MSTRVPNGWGDPSTERHLQVPPRHATGSRAAAPDRVMMAQIIAKAIHRSRLCSPMLPPSRAELQWAWDAAHALVEHRDEWENYGDPLAELEDA